MEPLITNNPRTIIQEVGEWADRQPWKGKNAPDYGVIEEVGELHHAILKNLQGIRGFDNVELFEEKVKDAFGDAMVYLSHWCYLKGCYYNLMDHSRIMPAKSFRECDMNLMIALSQLLGLSHGYGIAVEQSVCVTTTTRVTHALQEMAYYLGWNLLEDCLIPTWHKVKVRDWNKNKITGGDDEFAPTHSEMDCHGPR